MNTHRILRAAACICYLLAAAAFLFFSYYLFRMGTFSGKKVMALSLVIIAVPLCLATFFNGKAASDDDHKRRIIRAALYVLFGYYVVALLALLFFGYRSDSCTRLANLVPFHTIGPYINELFSADRSMTLTVIFDNLVGNFVLFMPLSLFLCCLFPTLRRPYIQLPLLLTLILLVECVQYISACGMFDVDDILLNFSGAALIFLLTKLPFVGRLFRRLHIDKAE